MKYIILNDFSNVISKWKIFTAWLFIILIYPIFLFVLGIDFGNDGGLNLFYGNIGSFPYLNSLIEFSMIIFNLGFLAYTVIYLFNLNTELGKENIYLRIPYKKWVLYKFLSITIIVSLLVTIELVSLFLIYKILGSSLTVSRFSLILIKDIIGKLLFSFLNLLLFQVFRKSFFVIAIFIYLVATIRSFNIGLNFISSILYSSKYNNAMPILVLCVIIFLVYLVSNKLMYKMFGGNE